ncbi:toprim domain-containing protein [Elizabethkingia miricola]|uniref:toprim domain-containing protein n=1 Tax=Elizabethkingia miricola TaxID=172045 RepID=UPI00201398F1|nr:toprim domain-containing protein [Elizabethkingia miricola]MCL1680610.1 toprim domain-containing protein [Elizabethkingia miricola]
MNCKQLNLIDLEEILVQLGHFPTKQNEKESWYINPFSFETKASFKLNKSHNCWYLFSEGIGGNNIDFVKKYYGYSVKEVLVWASAQLFSSFSYQTNNDHHLSENKLPMLNPTRKVESGLLPQSYYTKSNYKIQKILDLENKNLKRYLKERGVSAKVYPYIREVHFSMNNKQLYALGLENLSGGLELRNSFYKGCVFKKDISFLSIGNVDEGINSETDSHREYVQRNNNKNNYRNVSVFEGMMDMFSFIELQKSYVGDLLVLNSVALLGKAKEYLKSYSNISLFLDNDSVGLKSKTELQTSFPEAIDYGHLYSGHKDLNEFLMSMQYKS